MNPTFDQLPQAVQDISDKLVNIERLLLAKSDNPQPEADKLLTIQQAAELLHLTVPTIYGLVQRASIPVCKRGKRLYFSNQDLTSWIMAGRKRTVDEIDSEVATYLAQARHRKSGK